MQSKSGGVDPLGHESTAAVNAERAGTEIEQALRYAVQCAFQLALRFSENSSPGRAGYTIRS